MDHSEREQLFGYLFTSLCQNPVTSCQYIVHNKLADQHALYNIFHAVCLECIHCLKYLMVFAEAACWRSTGSESVILATSGSNKTIKLFQLNFKFNTGLFMTLMPDKSITEKDANSSHNPCLFLISSTSAPN